MDKKLKTFRITARLHMYGAEFHVDAENLGEALKKADKEFRWIYVTAANFPPENAIPTWGERMIRAVEVKGGGKSP